MCSSSTCCAFLQSNPLVKLFIVLPDHACSTCVYRNPIENYPDYRAAVLAILPYLRSLDFAKGTYNMCSTVQYTYDVANVKQNSLLSTVLYIWKMRATKG